MDKYLRKETSAENLPTLPDIVGIEDELHSDSVARRGRRLALALGIGVVLILLGLGALGRDNGMARGAHAGEPASDFVLPTFEGKDVRLSAFLGKPVVLNFWASWCAPCRSEATALSTVAAAVNDDIVFIGINVRDQEDDAREFIAEYNVSYRNVRDVDGQVEAMYSGIGIPMTVFIDSKGTIVRSWLGPLDERRLMAFLEELT